MSPAKRSALLHLHGRIVPELTEIRSYFACSAEYAECVYLLDINPPLTEVRKAGLSETTPTPLLPR